MKVLRAYIVALAAALLASSLACAQTRPPAKPAAKPSSATRTPAPKKPPVRKPAVRKPVAAAGPGIVIVKPASAFSQPDVLAFDAKADAMRDLGMAISRAKRYNSRVLILWGTNASDSSTRLCTLLTSDPRIARQLRYEFQLVLVDVGLLTRNVELAASHGATLQGSGLPYLTLLDSDGVAISNQPAFALQQSSGQYDAVRVFELLRLWQPRYPAAEPILSSAVKVAQSKRRLVLLRFVSPAAVDSSGLDEWLSLPETRAIMEKDFVEARIDVDRTVGGKDLMRQYCGNPPPDLPWFAFIQPATGEILATSVDAGGAIGFPRTQAEIERFVAILSDVCVHISDDDRQRLRISLGAASGGVQPTAQAAAAPALP